MPNEFMRTKLDFRHLLPNAAGLLLAASGSIILAWVGWLTWYDMTSWGKDITLIFFGPRTGEAISLGIDVRVIYYLLTGLALLLSGLLTLLRSLPKNAPILRDLVGKLTHASAKLVTGLILMTLVGLSLYLSPLRANTVAVVGVFASLSAIIFAFLAAVEIEVITVEEEKVAVDKTSLKRICAYEIVNDAARHLNFSQTNMHLTKTNEFKMDTSSSESQITMSSYYAPRRAHPVKLKPKRSQIKQ